MSLLHRVSTAALLVIAAGCASPGSKPSDRIARPAARPPDTQLLLLNVPEASGWAAYGAPGQDTREYHIVVSRVDDGRTIYESRVYLADNLQTHGFEMAEDDPRLLGIARQVDTGILAPLRKAANDTVPAASGPSPAQESAGASPPPAPDALEGVEVVSADADGMILRQARPDLLAPGDRIFLRTPPEYITDADGASILLSRGRVAALLEVTEVEGETVTVLRRSGEIPAEGYLEKAGE